MWAQEFKDDDKPRGGLLEVCEPIDWHHARWEIEMFFSALKVGLQIEKLQLDDTKLQTALVLYVENSQSHRPPHVPGAYLAGFASEHTV